MNKTRQTDGDAVTDFRLSGSVPAFVSLEGWSNKYLRVRPHTGDRGTYTFYYEAKDDDGWSNKSTITLTIINHPPKVDIPDFIYRRGDPALNIDIATYTTPTNGEPILSYAWLAGKLPAGLHWSGGQSAPPASTVYEDAEDGNTVGWDIFDNRPSGASITNVYDNDKRSRVIQLSGSSTSNGYRLRDTSRHNWNNTTQHIFSWDMKFSSRFYVYVMIDTTQGFRYLIYHTSSTQGIRGRSIYYKLGTGVQDGHWHTITRDLDTDLQEYQPGNHIRKIYGMLVRGSGRVDNIKLSDNPHLAGVGAFRGTPTETGDFFISAGAKDAGGIGVDTFKLSVAGPPITQDITPRSIAKGRGLAGWRLNTRNGNTGIKRTEDDPILSIEEANNTNPTYLHLDTSRSSRSYGKKGIVSLDSNAPSGTYSLKFRAKDRDGWSDWSTFTITVKPGTPPNTYNKWMPTRNQNEYFSYNLLHYRAVRLTEGDPILQYEYNGTIPGLTFDTASGVISGAPTTPGRYTITFRAQDVDGWSTPWKTLDLIVVRVDESSDICYDKPTYTVLPISGYTIGANLFCRPPTSDFRGGPGCKQIINLENIGTEDLTQVRLTIDKTPETNVPLMDCNVPDTGSSCQSPAVYSWGSHDFNKGVEFIMPDFDAADSHAIDVRTAAWTTDTHPMMDGTNLYVKYRDNSNTLHIAKVPFCSGSADYELDVDSNFTLIYGGAGTAVLGDMAATGDSILYVPGSGNTQDNDHYNGSLWQANTSYILTDSSFDYNATDGNKSNASTAKLNLPSYVKAKHIKWAGLFWQGYVHEPHASGLTLAQIKANINARMWNKVKIKFLDDNHTENVIANPALKDTNNTTFHLLMADRDSYRFFYSSYKNITGLVKSHFDDNSTSHEITVGNILTTAGIDYTDSLYVPHANNGAGEWNLDTSGGGSSVGYFGGWSIVVVYDLIGTSEAASSSEAYKNVSLYNGYDFFLAGGDGNVSFTTDIDLTGFKTPKHGTVDSRLLLFGGGADKTMTPDLLQMQNKRTTGFADISNGKNPSDNQFNSTYTINNNDINPVKPNHQGMDLDIFDVSNYMDHNQSTTKIRFGVQKIQGTSGPRSGDCDQVFPQVLGFSTQLYVPEICYDFNVHNGLYYRLPVGDDRNFSTHKIASDPLIFGIMIKSKNADFDMKNTTGGIKFHDSTRLTFEANNSLYSPPSINAYLPAVKSSSDSNFIALGEDVNESGGTSSGGTIGSNEINYAKFYYGFNDGNQVTDQFDLEVHTSVQFAPNLSPINFILSTAGNSSSPTHIDRCDVNQTYDPVYLWFNIERADVTDSTPNTPKDRYPLYTHVAGRDFGVSIASYSGPNFQTPHAYNSTVELEMISADSFENDRDNGYDSVCQDPDANAVFGKGKLWDFGTTNKDRITIASFQTSMSQIDRTVASRNAAYRVWVLTNIDANGTRTVVDYHETDKTKFKHVYDNNYKNKDDNTTHYCASSCASDDGTTKCYECVKKYFATPVCSRDNFAIRPEGFRIEVSDANGTTDINSSIVPIALTNNKTPASNIHLAAGYKYRLDGIAETFGYGGPSKGYTNIITVDNNTTGRGYDDYARLVFGGSAGCADKRIHDQSITFANSTTTYTPSNIINSNTSKYYYYVTDVNWTNVDRASYPHKTVFDPTCKNSTAPSCNDCLLHNKAAPASGKVGCLTSSTGGDSNYNMIPLTFEPYKFEVTAKPTFVGGVENNETDENNVTRTMHYFFMNDFGYRHSGDAFDYFDPSNHSITMAVTYDGNVTAQGADNGALSNFTDNCSASDVQLYVTFNDSNYTSGYTIQHYLQTKDIHQPFVDTLNKTIDADTNSTDDNRSSSDGNDTITIPAASFEDDQNGSVAILLHTTVKKPYRDLNATGYADKHPEINPVVLSFSKLTAEDKDAPSHVDMISHHIPEGNNTTGAYVTYLYGKVTPGKLFYDNVTDDNKTIAMYVDVYCNPISTEYDKPYLATPTYGADEDKVNWHLADMFAPADIGMLDIQAQHFGARSTAPYDITILNTVPLQQGRNQVNNVLMNRDLQGSLHSAMQQGINIKPNGAGRPSVVQVPFIAPPWLVHDIGEQRAPKIRFIGGGSWNGIGKTGNVIRTRSGRTPVPRMNW